MYFTMLLQKNNYVELLELFFLTSINEEGLELLFVQSK